MSTRIPRASNYKFSDRISFSRRQIEAALNDVSEGDSLRRQKEFLTKINGNASNNSTSENSDISQKSDE